MTKVVAAVFVILVSSLVIGHRGLVVALSLRSGNFCAGHDAVLPAPVPLL